MTISNTTASITHLGNGVNTLWAYGFKIPDSNSVVVTVIDPDAIETVLDAAIFSISGIGSDSGGVVTYPLTGSPLANGYSIRIDRAVALTQTTGFSNQSGLINSLIESAFDKLTMIAQDTKTLSARATVASQSVFGYVNVAAGYAAQAATSAAYAAGVAAGNAVLFTVQSLTAGQQAQARSNIGAAASGANGDITSLTGLTTALPVAQGGTGSTTGITLVPTGCVAHFAMSSAPAGWLKANGALVSRTTYAALFAAIGTAYGAGDGSTTFALPDLRGEFVRGWDDGRGIDSGRSIGSSQSDAMQGHYHNPLTGSNFWGNGGSSGSTGQPGGAGYAVTGGTTGSPTTDGTNGTPRIAAETRPRNVALLACIKY